MIVLGPAKDNAIGGARTWGASLNGGSPFYRLAFDVPLGSSPTMTKPEVVTNGQWQAFPPGNPASETWSMLAESFDQCCYFNEVLLVAHGHQTGVWTAIRDLLTQLLDRPVQKLALWICAGDRDRFPFTGYKSTFGEIAYAVRPFRSCPCGCDHEDCRSYSADGNPEKCPVGDSAKTTILSAGYYDHNGRKYPSKLSLDPANQQAPFGAPDGCLIETTVTHTPGSPDSVDYSPIAQTGNISVFAGKQVHSEPSPDPPSGSYPINPQLLLKPAKGKKQKGSKRADYQGPTSNDIDCPHQDGCMTGFHRSDRVPVHHLTHMP